MSTRTRKQPSEVMLSYNVAGLLRAAPGTSREYPVHAESLEIADDVSLAAPVEGTVRLSRTGRSILAQATVRTAIEEHCSRCLRPVAAPVEVSVFEEALPSIDIDSGQPVDRSAEPDALRLDDHHELDLTEPIREAVSLAEPIAPLCRPDCAGLCEQCGADLNADPTHAHGDASIDPRLAALAGWDATTHTD
jgi:DUF177 domain-containing protein